MAFDFHHIQTGLDAALLGLQNEKKEIITCLKILELNQFDFEKIICLTGPEGVGKKSLVHFLSGLIGYEFIHLKIGSIGASTALPVYGKTKIGEVAGQIIQVMCQHQDENLVILLENIENLIPKFQNTVIYNLKEVLRISHDHALQMNHIHEPLDFGRVIFFSITADISLLGNELLSQMEYIHFSGYTIEEKIKIAQKKIIPEQQKICGLHQPVHISDDLIYLMIAGYTNDIGLSRLNWVIQKFFKNLIYDLSLSPDLMEKKELDAEALQDYLGPPLFETRTARHEDEIGVITTIGRSNGHGVISELEVLLFEDTEPGIILTGNMDAIFREVVIVGISYLLSNFELYEIEKNFNRRYSVHFNMIPGGILKSGVSAGLAIVISLYSALKKKPVNSGLSAIGEITLHGKVKKVGGLYEKLIIASRLGIRKILIPKENSHDIRRLPEDLTRDIELIEVKTIHEAFLNAF